MASRELPVRGARTLALNLIQAEREVFPLNIAIDDAAEEDDRASTASDFSANSEEDEVLEANDLEEVSSSSSDSEVEISQTEAINGRQLESSSGVQWRLQMQDGVQGRAPAINLFRGRAGFSAGLHPANRKEAFLVIMQHFVDITVQYTNAAGRRFSQENTWRRTDEEEILAFIGLHLLAGVFKGHHRDTKELWSERDGHLLCIATMSFERFLQLKKAMRFDDSRRRDRNDKLAPIRAIVDGFNAALRTVYNPGPYLCVDEMLIEFHGRVSFRQYIPSKPGKFGIKVFWCVDVDNTVPVKAVVYIGGGTTREDDPRPFAHRIVLELAADHLHAGRNITADNFFTSKQLCEDLLQQNTTFLGTVRQNRRELPPAAKLVTGRVRGDSKHYYTENISLCSFWDKKSCPVLLMSSMHRGPLNNTQSREEGKPDMVLEYNRTKGAVDNLDKLVRGYSCKRKCRRWPYSVAMSLVDVAVVCAHKMMVSQCESLDDHNTFRKELAYELCHPLMNRRIQQPHLRVRIKHALLQLGVEAPSPPNRPAADHQAKSEKLKRCSFCPRNLDKKTRQMCWHCQKHVCADHQVVFCQSCSEDM